MTDPTPQVGDVVLHPAFYSGQSKITGFRATFFRLTTPTSCGGSEETGWTAEQLRGFRFTRNGQEGVYL